MTKQDTDNSRKQKAVDYDRIEPEWRAGVKSVLQLAADYERATGQKVSHTAIRKHFNKKGIERDLADQVQAKAKAKVAAAAVSTQVSAEQGIATKPTETAIVEANATLVADTLLTHRKDIARSRRLTMRLLDELEGQCDNPDLLEQLGMLMYKPDENGKDKLNELYHKIIAMPGRVDSMKKLADTLKTLVGLERQAYGMIDGDGGKTGSGSLEDYLDSLPE